MDLIIKLFLKIPPKYLKIELAELSYKEIKKNVVINRFILEDFVFVY